jgi:CheY-like chemotaxis protein
MSTDSVTIPVLIVDPDPADRSLTINQLSYGPLIGRFRVYDASNATEALSCLNRYSVMFCDAARPGILITEVKLPEHDEAGWDLIQTVQNNPQTRHICTVCLTHRADSTSKIRGVQQGSDYIIKPTNPQEFPYRLLLLAKSQLLPSSLQGTLFSLKTS